MLLNTDICLAYNDNPDNAMCLKKQGKLMRKRNFKKCKWAEGKGTFLNAKTSSCCAWTSMNQLWNKKVLTTENHYCGMSKDDFIEAIMVRRKWHRKELELYRPDCCVDQRADSMGDCDSFHWPGGRAFKMIRHLGGSN